MDHAEKYHRAVWALDSDETQDSHIQCLHLQLNWHWLAHFLSVEGADEGNKARALTEFIERCDRAIGKFEKNPHRTKSEMQRDFLLDVVGRVVWATRKNAVHRLRFYRPDREDFHVPDLGTGYWLWQGTRAELKAGVTLAGIDPERTPHNVLVIADRARAVIHAMETGNHESLPKYEHNPMGLNLSQEQYKKLLWEGVVHELRWILRDEKRQEATSYFN